MAAKKQSQEKPVTLWFLQTGRTAADDLSFTTISRPLAAA
jgi:hypothetical protein